MNQKDTSFEKQGIIIFMMSIFASGLNYLFQIVSGRILDPIAYGELNSLFSIINILAVIGSSLGLSIVKYVAEMQDDLGANIRKIFKQCSIIAIPLSIAIVLVMTFLMHYNIWSSIFTTMSIISMALAFVLYGVLQGKKRFFQVGIYNMIQPVAKMVLGTVLLVIGLHYNSALIVMTIGSVGAMLYARKCMKEEMSHTTSTNEITIKNIYKYFLFTLISMVCLTIFNNIDILLVRSYFSEEIVGQYSSAALFGKIILYIPQALTIMMVPIVAEHNGNERKTLFKTMGYSLGLAGCACTGLYVLRRLVITILMGEKYLPSLEYILPVCVMMLPLVAVTVLINYLIAYGDKWFVTISSAIGIVAVLVVSTIMHGAVTTMIYSIAIVYAILFAILLARSLMLKPVKNN